MIGVPKCLRCVSFRLATFVCPLAAIITPPKTKREAILIITTAKHQGVQRCLFVICDTSWRS